MTLTGYLQENIQQVLTFDQHEHGTIIDIVEDGGKHDILELHLRDGRDVDTRRLVPEQVVAAKIEEIEVKKLQDAENKRMRDEHGWANESKTLLKEQIILTFMTVCWLISRLLETQHYM